MKKTTSREAGFSLLELAISMIIVSILMAGVLGSYHLWIKQKREKETIDHAEAMAFAIQGFFATHGRYPCPAPLNVQRTDSAYGKEPAGPTADTTGCASTSIPVGSCSGGICIAQSGRTVTANFDGNDTTPETTASPRIRIGAVPFRDIGFDELLSLDGYDNKYLYAVTEFQASKNGIGTKPDTGGINIIDRSGNTILGTASSADYVVLSHGEDRVGAYNFIGSASAVCPGTNATMDQENCDNDATFRSMDHADIAGTNHFDDIVRHEAPASSPRWAYSPGGDGNIHHLFTDGNLGGDFAYNWYQSQPHASTDYQAFEAAVGANTKLWITGNVLVEGDVKTDSYCDKEKDDCFDPDMIAGEGIECPAGKIMKGISNGQAECTDGWEIKCSGREVITGIDKDGKAVCGHIPCKASTGTAGCGGDSSQPLPASDHGISVTIRGGINNCASRTYVCMDGRWSPSSQEGFCACPPTTQTLSCPTYCGYPGGDPHTQTGTDNCSICQYPSNWVTTSSCPATADCPPPVDTSSTSTSTSTSTSSSGDTSSTSSSSSSTSGGSTSSGGGSTSSTSGTSSSTSSTSSSSTSSSGSTSGSSTSGSSGGPTSSSGMGSSSGGGHVGF